MRRKRNPEMKENVYQSQLIQRIKKRFHGCIVLKNDPNYIQGVPDLLVLYKDKWFALEVKASKGSNVRPNQDYYVKTLNRMSFASFIFPENEEEVLDAIQAKIGA